MFEASAEADETEIVSEVEVEQTPVISHLYQPFPTFVIVEDVAVPAPIDETVPLAPVERLNQPRSPFVSDPSARVNRTQVAVEVLK